MLTVEINQVDREVHEECVYGFAGNDPKPGPLVEFAVLQKTRSALRTVSEISISLPMEVPRVVSGPGISSPL